MPCHGRQLLRWLPACSLLPGNCWCSVTQSCLTLCDPMYRSTPGSPVLHYSQSLLRFMSIESMMPCNHLVLCRPLLLLPLIFPSIRVISNKSALSIRWPKYWSFGFSIHPSNEYLELIYFRIDWFDLLVVQGTVKSFLQYHSSKALICIKIFIRIFHGNRNVARGSG